MLRGLLAPSSFRLLMTIMSHTVPSITTITLRWLLGLRWVGMAGQMITLAIAGGVLMLELPLLPLLAVIGFTAVSNIVLLTLTKHDAPHHDWAVASVIGADVLLLTVLIYLTGGASNPFSSFYLVLIALAAMSLGVCWLAFIVALSAGAYMFIFYNGLPLKGPNGIGEIGCPGYGLHLQGMAVAFFLTALSIAYFVQRMYRSLRSRDAALAEAETRAARADQFSAIAVLAAGVAHELGSPLGTIAVASRELEVALAKLPSAGPLEDATLIRQEVERCRTILYRLDRRSTSGTGDAPEPCSAAMLISDLRAAMPVVLNTRLVIRDLTQGVTLHLPKQPVVQSLIILIHNACEADTSGQPVELEITHEHGQLRLTVLDRGPGMTAAAQKHAGEPFFTTKPPRQGMGLGLFLVRTLALQLGGEITHQMRESGGTSACFEFPATLIES
jgi:two-component system sensor histidine kinase RegB